VNGDDPSALDEEQAALRRVATLAAGGAEPQEVFAAVTEEVGRLLPVDFAIMGRYDAGGTITTVAGWGAPAARFPVGGRSSLDGKNLVTIVHDTGHSARVDGYEHASGAIGVAGRESGFHSAVGAPVIVDGHVWGVMTVGSTLHNPALPAATEARLAQFTELLAMAISNAESRAGLARLAEEQAALRRVATLVADGAAPEEVFAAVTEEVGRLLPVQYAGMGRYDPDGTMTHVADFGRTVDDFPIGRRSSLGGRNVATLVFETGRSARIDAFADASGPIGLTAREEGQGPSVGTPIVVEGRIWGVMAAGSSVGRALPRDTEARLAQFTELVATAIANAESHAGLTMLAEEQAALRRVATLVARGVPQSELFATVAEEVGQLLCAEYAGLRRYEPDGKTTTIVAVWGRTREPVPPDGGRQVLGGRNISTLVFETGRPARVDGYDDSSGQLGRAAREYGIGSSIGAPIVVEGRVWGVMTIYSTEDRPLPAGSEARLASFTELVATSIANAESGAGLARLAEEQAALRRVATLVAGGTPNEELFDAVAEEAGRLLPVDFVHVGRYDPDNAVQVLATWGSTADHFPPGRRWSLGGRNLATIVHETGQPGRLDGYGQGSGTLGVTGRELGIRSSVGTPILVESRVWGVVIAGSTVHPALPPATEARLASFTELVATAIANAESRAALAASRARIVAAADDSRRRIERDLHDGAQQRLVHAVIVLKLAQRALSSGDGEAGALVAEALRHAEDANAELRELAHGILPAALTRGGLRAGVDGLLSRVSLPVSADVAAERLPAGVEATAYFVISEALTNVVKHARATSVSVTTRIERGELRVEVCDDGAGGALGGPNTGLGGLEDRVSAMDGRLELESPPGEGTRVCARLPISDSA
jgi:GAF domain-containing protein